MQPGTKLLFTSAKTEDDGRAIHANALCIPLQPVRPGDLLPSHSPILLVLEQLRAPTAESSGPFVVYLETAGTTQHDASHRIGSFSLYSVQGRPDGQNLSFNVDASLVHRLLTESSSHSGLQACIEHAGPARKLDAASFATLEQVLLVALPPQ